MKIFQKFVKPIIIGITVAVICSGAFLPNVPLNKGTDQFIYRLCSRYDIEPPPSLFIQPMNVGDLRDFFILADSLDNEGKLSETESTKLKLLKREVLSERGVIGWEGEKRDTRGTFHLSLLGEIEPSYTDSAAVFMGGHIVPELRGNIGPVSYYSGLDVATEYKSDSFYVGSNFEPYNGVPYTLYGREDSSHARVPQTVRGGLLLKTKHFLFETAVDDFRTGPCVYTPLTFSGTAPPVTYFRARFDMGQVKYYHSFGLLKSQKDKQKNFYTHRLDIPFKRLPIRFAINEVIVTGSTTDERYIIEVDGADITEDFIRQDYIGDHREFEWVYCIPFIPFSFAEPYIGDRDNAVISFDLNVFFPENFRWYGEFFLDDITTPLTIFSDDWGNKWAATAGVQYFGQVLQKDFSATFEYARVEPWVYTHFRGGSHRYSHFGQSLGAELGPNSDALNIVVEASLNARHSLGFTFGNFRKNKDARGGSIDHVYQREEESPDRIDADTKEFLGDGTKTTTETGVLWRFNQSGLFRVNAHLVLESTDDHTGGRLSIDGGFIF